MEETSGALKTYLWVCPPAPVKDVQVYTIPPFDGQRKDVYYELKSKFDKHRDENKCDCAGVSVRRTDIRVVAKIPYISVVAKEKERDPADNDGDPLVVYSTMQ